MAKPNQILIIDPPNELVFQGPGNSSVMLRLKNPSDRSVCFKLQATVRNRFIQYSQEPYFGFIGPNIKNQIKVALGPLPIGTKPDKFIIQSIFAPADGYFNQKHLWKKVSQSDIMESVLRCSYAFPDGKTKSSAPESEIQPISSSPKVTEEEDNNNEEPELPLEFRKKYEVVRELGNGHFGKVRICRHIESERMVAIKMIKKKMDTSLDEVKTLQVYHPAIIRMEDVSETNSVLCFILELACGGSLLKKMEEKKEFEENEAKIYFYQMVSGLQYLHSLNIAHRDLRPENILLCSEDDLNPVVKISDTGLSGLVDDDFKSHRCAMLYRAPEFLFQDLRVDDDFKGDMWSLGVILYQMLANRLPYTPPASSVEDLENRISRSLSSATQRIGRSPLNLIRNLLKVRASRRPSAEQTLDHLWLEDEEIINKVDEIWQHQAKGPREVVGQVPDVQVVPAVDLVPAVEPDQLEEIVEQGDEDDLDPPQPEPGSKPNFCMVCNRDFASLTNLNKHRQTNTHRKREEKSNL